MSFPLCGFLSSLYPLDSTQPVHTVQVLEERFPGTLLLPDVRELQELPEVRHAYQAGLLICVARPAAPRAKCSG